MASITVVWEVCYGMYDWVTLIPSQCVDVEKAYQDYLSISQNVSFTFHQGDSINFSNMDLKVFSSGNVYPVRRLIYPPNSAFGKGVTWQWDSAGQTHSPVWVPYSAEVVHYIEKKYSKDKTGIINLAKKFPNLDYSLDFTQNIQCNNQTAFQRQIQRVSVAAKYPVESRAVPHTSTGDVTSSVPGTSSGLSGGDRSRNHIVPDELKKYAKAVLDPPDEMCCICRNSLCDESAFASQSSGSTSDAAIVVALLKCDHSFHTDCLIAAVQSNGKKSSLSCPYCKKIYGIKTGIQPPGTMTHRIMSSSLPGHTGSGTIQITYHFRSGVQTAEHPNPGQRYHANSFPRVAYLPDNKEGRKIFEMLKIAWDRKLIFTIGRSVTTGADNTITWNEIHHKTETSNYSGHGYPDPNYFTNVVEELKAQGVTEEDLRQI